MVDREDFQFLLTAGAPGKRYTLPNARIMMHQPLAGLRGQASDIAIQAEQLRYTKKRMAELIAHHSGQSIENIMGPMMERNLYQALNLAHGDLTVFIRRPISATLLTIIGAAAALTAVATSSPPTDSSTLVDAQIVEIYVFLLAAFTGFQIITKVPPLLHTPLMAATNAISAISLVASIVLAGAERPLFINIMGMVAVAAATINVVGGFVIPDRRLKMFKKTEAPK